ncbi:hypothetical protein ACLRGF_05495 [Mycetocola zhadangensis]|uniref:YobI family P-loop NTPase n=1 Tax=Mycetocola zhadangensis TaxID=1164595 RepID=UPI003A4E1805
MGDAEENDKSSRARATDTHALSTAGVWLRRLVLDAWEWIREPRKRDDALTLLPLTPEYAPEKHGVYLDALEQALKTRGKPVLNIALTGSYGVGKSSILQEVTRRHKRKVISISLSTLGFADEPARGNGGVASTKTNRIQKEIVKHLLYGEDPVKMPGSRYRRMTRFRFWREFGFAALLAAPIAVVFYLTGWSASLATLFPLTDEWSLLTHGIWIAGLVLLIFGFRFVFHNRIQIDKISAGSATISLSATSATYFDEYLDEIVYFFEMIRRDIVIFEDIDRFDDPHIFETLRSLNSILNGAKQLRRRRIRFVYAIKDSIFDELGARAAAEELDEDGKKADTSEDDDAAMVEVARANRTKFFDLVVPVVPFITHRSARDLIIDTMRDLDHKVSNNLVDLAARHVADMRLIKNVRNEFAIFKRLVIDTGDLDLNQDKLFAMMLYKSTHLSDFELIKLGKSNLDDLYKDGRALVIANVSALNATVRTSRAALSRVGITGDHSVALGKQLLDHIKIALFGLNGRNVQALTLNNNALEEAALSTSAFWESLASSNGTLAITYLTPRGYQEVLSLNRAEIEDALGQPITSAAWADAERARLDQIIAQARSDREFLTHADMAALAGRPEFRLSREGEELSFAELTKDRLNSELAVQLLAGAYIDRHFTMYTSTFYGERISANATNYVLKNVDPNITDMYFPLSERDVDDIVREKGNAVLQERSGYNVSLLDRLLVTAPESAALVVSKIMTNGNEEQEFLLTYLEDGLEREALVRDLANRWPRALVALTDAELDASALRQLIDVALQNLDPGIDYVTNDALHNYLLDNFAKLAAFTSDETTEPQAALLAKLLHQVGARLPELIALGVHVLPVVVSGGNYALNRENLFIALGDSSSSLSLDAISGASAAVYARVLADLTDYLGALHDTEDTVLDNAAFESVIKDVVSVDGAQLGAVISRAERTCRVDDLARVPAVSWHALAEDQRFPATFPNVYAYLIEVIGTDQAIMLLLEEAGEIDISDGPEEPAKVEVALAILRAIDELPSAAARVHLATTLSMADPVPVSSVPVEPGELIGRLIKAAIVADAPETFAAIPSTDVAGLAFAIQQSESFLTFLATTHVTPANIAALMDSSVVPREVKDAIARRFEEFTAGATSNALTAVARYARGRGITLAFDQVARLASEGLSSILVVALLEPHLESLSTAELAPVLRALGGRYPDLAEPNGKHPHIPNTTADRALLERLRALDVVSSVTERAREFRVNMRQR